jgi:hypothetical protein
VADDRHEKGVRKVLRFAMTERQHKADGTGLTSAECARCLVQTKAVLNGEFRDSGARVQAEMPGAPARARDTVDGETPAMRASWTTPMRDMAATSNLVVKAYKAGVSMTSNIMRRNKRRDHSASELELDHKASWRMRGADRAFACAWKSMDNVVKCTPDRHRSEHGRVLVVKWCQSLRPIAADRR